MTQTPATEKNPLNWIFSPFTTMKAIHFLVGIGFIVFLNSMFNAFVADDLTYIVRNPDIPQMSIMHLFGLNDFTRGEYYRPLSAVYFSILYHFSGTSPFLFHFIQIIFHIGTSMLFFFFLRLFFKEKLSFFLAAVFLIHPVQVESVAYISGTTNILMLFFGLIALLLGSKKSLRIKDYFGMFVCLVFAFFAKETTLFFLGLILLYALFFIPKRILSFAVVGIASFLVYFVIRVVAVGIPNIQKVQANGFPIFNLDLFHRILNIPLIFMHYLSEFFFPTTLAFMQNWIMPSLSFSYFYLPLTIDILFLAVVLGVGLFFYQRKQTTELKIFIFFSIWFFASIGFLLQIFPLDGTVADRWLYDVLPGLLGMIGVIFRKPHFKVNERFVIYAAISILFLFSLRTIYRNWDWQNGITLYTHDLPISEGYFIENSLVEELLQTGDYTNAINHLKKSLTFSDTPESHNDLGVAYQHIGKIEQAEIEYHKAIALSKQENGIPYFNLANMLILQTETPTEGVTILKNILLKHFPQNQKFWMLLALGEYKLYHLSNALEAANKAVSLANIFQSTYLLDFIKENRAIQDFNNNVLQ